MSKDEEKNNWLKFAEHELTLSGFLGGLTLSSLVLIMQTKEAFEFTPVSAYFYYPELLIDGLAVIIVFFIMAAVGLVKVASGGTNQNSKFTKIAENCLSVGFYGLCGFIPLLLLPFSIVGSIGVSILIIMCIIWYIKSL